MDLFKEVLEFVIGLKELKYNSETIINKVGREFEEEFKSSKNNIGIIRRPEGLTLVYFDEQFELRIDANIYVPNIQAD